MRPSYVRYREMRNRTSHTYDADQAEQTVAMMDEFLRDMYFLLKGLGERNRETGLTSLPLIWRQFGAF